MTNLPLSNGTCEQMMREVMRTLEEILQEERRDICEWVDVVPAVQWALNTVYCERNASTPYHFMLGQVPLTSFSILASSTGEDRKVDVLVHLYGSCGMPPVLRG